MTNFKYSKANNPTAYRAELASVVSAAGRSTRFAFDLLSVSPNAADLFSDLVETLKAAGNDRKVKNLEAMQALKESK